MADYVQFRYNTTGGHFMPIKYIYLTVFIILSITSLFLVLMIRRSKQKYINDPQDKYLIAVKRYTVYSILVFTMMFVMTVMLLLLYLN